ncbi:MAG: metallophosphoesterase family protein [Chitinispirillales bacterium]|jgi:hypothetical protein|nr:metallophosphoesterase family protein [Chitinispirillales bacterium]
MNTFPSQKMSVNAALFAAALLLAASAFSQTLDTAKVPVRVNVAATVSILPPSGSTGGVGVTRNLTANTVDTLLIGIERGALPVSHNPQTRANAPAVFKNSAGSISVALSAQSYRNAEISLYAGNGKRLLRDKVSAQSPVNNISRPNMAAGAYLLSIKGINDNAVTTRYIHGGGSLNIGVAFVNEGATGAEALRKEANSSAAGDWTITATAPEHIGESRQFTPVAGINPIQNFTLSQEAADSAGFVPEALGIGVGATTSEQRFVWFSDSTAANNKSFVRIFNASGAIVSTDSGEARGASKDKRYHKVAAQNLSPNTEYRYSVSNNKTDWSRKYGFKTPGTGAFAFAVAGDMHQGYVPDPDNNRVGAQRAIIGWDTTMKRIAARDVNFIASVGDHIDTADHDEFYKPFFAPTAMRNIPFSAAMGNHDINDLFVYHFNLPNTASRSLMISYSPTTWYGSYWYLYNNALFVVLNTGAYLIKSTSAEKLTEARAHVNYFDSIITKARNAHIGKYDWLFVQHHKSTESVGAHAQDEEIQLYKQAGFELLMDKHNVDLVFAGHDHIYVRTKPMKNGSVATSGGTVYLTLPTASYTKFYPEESSLVGGSHIAKYKKNNWNGWPGFGIVNVNGKSISAIIYNYNTSGGADVGLDTLSLSK